MNLFNIIFCRSYQFMFKLAIPLLPYRFPSVLNSLAEVPAFLKARSIDHVLIVTDVAIHSYGIIEPLKHALQENGIKFSIYDETVPNPTVKNVEEAHRIYIENGCQALIGFGGGSCMDCAKIVGARIARPKKSVCRMKGIFKIMKKLPTTIAVPTTAGTGSETTLAALITDSDTQSKFTINDFSLLPDAAVLDPEVTRTLPQRITATTGMDALTHAVEAYIGRSTVKSTRAAATKAIRLIVDNLETAYADSNNMTARQNMLHASYLAGQAFTVSYVGYCHAVAHTLGGKYNTPHGLANAVLLPHVLEAYGSSVYNKLKELAIVARIAGSDTPAETAARSFIEMIRQMNARMNIPDKLRGICAEDISMLAAKAEKEANPLYPVPRLMTRHELEQFYYKVMENAE